MGVENSESGYSKARGIRRASFSINGWCKMKGLRYIIEMSKKMEDADAVLYLEYHRHMQAMKLERLKGEVSGTEEAIEALDQEIARRKSEEKANRE